MTRALLTVLLPILFLAAPAAAQSPPKTPPPGRAEALQALAHKDANQRREAAARLGELGIMADARALAKALRDADDDTREAAEKSLWQIWARSGSAEVDNLYRTGVEQMGGGERQKAISTFTRVIELKPDFAEGWNKRATLYFITGDYRKSLADCDEVIKRNPQHFGALAGYGQIYLRLEEYDRALDYFRRALAVNPNMDSVRLNILLLEKMQDERMKRMI
jgi:tetratricopeptide (TPR) repeat protein